MARPIARLKLGYYPLPMEEAQNIRALLLPTAPYAAIDPCVSNSMDRPALDEEWLEAQRSYHSLDIPLPAILLYFRPGDAVMACFDDECEYWGQETPEPNLIVPLRPNDSANVRQALAVIDTVMRVLTLTVRVKTIIESREKSLCDSASMSAANSN